MPVNRFAGRPIADIDGDLFTMYGQASSFFRLPLTDDGTDATLNENYSSATDAYVQFSRPAVISTLGITIVDADVAQNTIIDPNLFIGDTAALTNGLKLQVKNSAGTQVLDITTTNALRTLADVQRFLSIQVTNYAVGNATSTNNRAYISGRVDFDQHFGRAIAVNTGDRFVCTLQDNLSGLSVVSMIISGFYL